MGDDFIDGAFGAHLTGQETIELRRWILGAESGRASRARGLRKRVEDLILDDATAITLMGETSFKADVTNLVPTTTAYPRSTPDAFSTFSAASAVLVAM